MISYGLNLLPCDVDPNSRLTFEEGILGGLAPPKDREFPPMQCLIRDVLLLEQRWDKQQRGEMGAYVVRRYRIEQLIQGRLGAHEVLRIQTG